MSHLSYLEASAFAQWAGARLLDEAEWEVQAARSEIAGNFVEAGFPHPRPTYRNFFYPHCRWQFAGIRLGRD